MEYLERKEIGDYRITIFPDEDALCPMTDWDLAGLYLFEYERGGLHSECNWSQVFGKYGDSKHTLREAMRVLIEEHCSFTAVVDYIRKGNIDGVRLRYERSEHMWKLEVYEYCWKSGKWDLVEDIPPTDLRAKEWCYFENLFEYLSKRTLMDILRQCAPNLYVDWWGSRGYCQGDSIDGIVFCTKERFDEMCGRTDKPWRECMPSIVEGEVDCIGKWAWGDVKGFMLERKVTFTKVYDDPEREPKPDYEWEFVDSCWGYYTDSADELIREVMAEHNIKEEVAA